jgi:hypothetical protein
VYSRGVILGRADVHPVAVAVASTVHGAAPAPVARLLREKRMVRVSRWNSAAINQHFLRGIFRPKLEWPADADE